MNYKTKKRKLQRKKAVVMRIRRGRFMDIQRRIAFEEWTEKNLPWIIKEYMEGVR